MKKKQQESLKQGRCLKRVRKKLLGKGKLFLRILKRKKVKIIKKKNNRSNLSQKRVSKRKNIGIQHGTGKKMIKYITKRKISRKF